MLALVVGFLKLIVGLSAFVLSLLAVFLFILAFPVLFTVSVAGGIFLLLLAFLFSPFGIALIIGGLLVSLQGLYSAVRGFLFS